LESNLPGQSTIKQKLSEDLKQALRSGDKARVGAIRLLISAINNAEIAKLAQLTDADIYSVIQREIRQREESIESFKKGNRPDLVAQEEAELAVLRSYLPAQASRSDIEAAARKIIEETGAQGPKDKGKVMPRLVAEFKGKADGRVLNEIVTELLNKI